MPGSKIQKRQSTVPDDAMNDSFPEKRPQSRSGILGPDSEAPTAEPAILQRTLEIVLKVWSVDSNAISSGD